MQELFSSALFLGLLAICTSFKIEGRVTVPDKASLSDIRILIDDGLYRAFLRYLSIVPILNCFKE